MDRRLNHVEAELRELRSEFRGWIRWMLGMLITMWVTIVLTVLFKA